MQQTIPGVYVRHNKGVTQVLQEDFATLFISFCEMDFEKPLVVLENFAQVHEYPFLQKNQFLCQCIDTYFANKGKKLYLLQYNFKSEESLDLIAFEAFIARQCDVLMDIEVLVALDVYHESVYKKRLSQKSIVGLQRTLNLYAVKTNRIALTDITSDLEERYLDVLAEGIVYYPWIVDKEKNLLPPSVFASALMSRFAKEGKFFNAVANKEMLNAIDVNEHLSKEKEAWLIQNGINPIVYVPHRGVRIWGSKTFNSKVATAVELRVLKYIKRNLIKIAKVYIFEPNDENLEDKLVMQVDNFLYKLWERGALVGTTKEEAYQIHAEQGILDGKENNLIIHVGVALVRPIEFIQIVLNKLAQDGTQSTLSVI